MVSNQWFGYNMKDRKMRKMGLKAGEKLKGLLVNAQTSYFNILSLDIKNKIFRHVLRGFKRNLLCVVHSPSFPSAI